MIYALSILPILLEIGSVAFATSLRGASDFGQVPRPLGRRSTGAAVAEHPSPFIIVTASDPHGEDASHRLSFLHDEQSVLAPSNHRKRVTGSRRMDECSHPSSHFFSSYCQGVDEPLHSDNPLSVEINCNDLTPTRNWTDPSPDYRYETFCREHEICVTQWDVPNPWLEDTDEADVAGDTLVDVAWCVSQENFVKIAQDQVGGRAEPDAVAAPFHPSIAQSKRPRFHVEASLRGSGGHAATAERILIEAQAPGLVSGEKVWHTLIGGANICDHCSKLDLKVVPPTKHRIFVHVILPFGALDALLYLSSFAF